MEKIYLFDWGDTLMIDFQNQQGKMSEWAEVKAVDGAFETLSQLSHNYLIYVATNAADSTENDIRKAFERVGLAQFISGYFCKSNLGIGKGTPEFFHLIAKRLNISPEAMVMVGDTYEKDIEPALKAGVTAIWLRQNKVGGKSETEYSQIESLTDLIS